MTEQHRPAVRPAFLKASIVVFILLIPCVLFTAWDYYESARQDRLLGRIDPDGALLAVPGLRLTQEEERSERFYRAASVLAAIGAQTTNETKVRLSRLSTVARQNSWSADSLVDLRAVDADYAEALEFATRAAGLPFKDFTPGTSFNYQTGNLLNVQRFLGYRAMLHALSGDDAGAVDAMYVEARLARTFNNGLVSLVMWQGEDIARALERTHGAADKLELLAQAIGDADEMNDRNESAALAGLTRRILAESRVFAGSPSYWLYVLSRPITHHIANAQLDVMAEALPAARLPWPDRIDREIDVGRPIGITPKPLTPREYVERSANDRASRVATFRCVRLALAVERFRRERGAFPASVAALVPNYLPAPLIDPFSGKPLLLKKLSDGYVAYSVGPNRSDDGGAIVEPPAIPFGAAYPQDAGIRMRDR
jgi:hypothetical protein